MLKHLAVPVLIISSALSALAQKSVLLTWTANTNNPVNVGYNIFRAPITTPGTCALMLTFTKLNAASIPGLTYTDATSVPGSIYCYYATATLAGDSSAPSPITEVTVPPNLFPPGKPSSSILNAAADLPVVDGSIKLAENKYVDVYTTPHDTRPVAQVEIRPWKTQLAAAAPAPGTLTARLQ